MMPVSTAERFRRSKESLKEVLMRIVVCSTFALLFATGAAVAFPTEEVPTSEAAYVAKVKTAAPEQIVSKASIVRSVMMAHRSALMRTVWHG
jgi:hypothetical protein